jgi:hypothetical protein
MSQIVERISPLFGDDRTSRSPYAIRFFALGSCFHRNYSGLKLAENQLSARQQEGGDPRRAQPPRTGSQDFHFLISSAVGDPAFAQLKHARPSPGYRR